MREVKHVAELAGKDKRRLDESRMLTEDERVSTPVANRREVLLKRIAERDFVAEGRRLPLRIAGLRVDLVTESSALAEELVRYFDEYLVTGGAAGPDIVAELSVGALGASELGLWEDADPEYHVTGDSVVQRDFVARKLPSGPDSVHRATAWVPPVACGASMDPVHNLLRWFLPVVLLERGAFLMHAAGIVRDGNGYVCFGESGAGKSTSASLVAAADPAAILLGDDSVIIQCDEKGVTWLHAAPLGCGYTRAAPPAVSVPLAGLYRLRQSDRHSIDELSPAEGVATLLASAMNAFREESLAERFGLALRFARSAAGVRELRFARDAGFWPVLRAAARHAGDGGSRLATPTLDRLQPSADPNG